MKFFDPRIKINKCNILFCPLKNNQIHKSEFVCFEYYGELQDIKILFVGEAPGEMENKYKRPFYPNAPSGKIIRQVSIDLNIKNYAFANIVCCRPTTEIQRKINVFHNASTIQDIEWIIKNRTPNEKECNYCSDHLKIFINNIYRYPIIFLLGKTAAFTVLGKNNIYIGNNTTITQLTKLPSFIYNGRKFAACFHPRYIKSNGGLNSNLYQKYLNRFKEILNE